ncbi:hypothetical protein [Ectopseudomonas guguanensis]|uniref:Fis family transcriptional regulator n=2 Tax=cellular organisms TaxID=131567 RepID=A0A177UJ01_9BASI|nr:hypothetical protein [Pseudomonas sp.]KAE8262996.1 hypothetical protein A4X03_0g2006 [Tilletia caries]
MLRVRPQPLTLRHERQRRSIILASACSASGNMASQRIPSQRSLMSSPKRKHAGIERELIRTLTFACETAKSEIVGFQWLTHEVDYQRFPQSLVVTWMFDSEASRARSLASSDKARMLELTLAAFDEVGISVSSIAEHVAFSVERPARGKRGQGH